MKNKNGRVSTNSLLSALHCFLIPKIIPVMKRLLVLFVCAVFWVSLSAQDKWEAGLFLGFSSYQGDFVVEDYAVLKEIGVSVGLHGRYVVSDELSIRLSGSLANIKGDDFNYPERMARGFSFDGTVIELASGVLIEPFGKRRRPSSMGFQKIVSPYVFFGFGLAIFNPEVDFAVTSSGGVEWPGTTEDRTADYNNITPVTPIGVGVKIDLSREWVLGVEFGLRPTFTDYLDGVSFSGNPDKNDWYQIVGLNMMYRVPN